jgi:hypothetical protein
MGIGRELLTEGEFEDRLFLATPEESEGASKDRTREADQRPHGEAILRDRAEQNESESRNRPSVSSMDGR